jgi:hypothetical protein
MGTRRFKPSTRWALGMSMIIAWFLVLPVTPLAAAYFSVVPMKLHMFVFFIAAGALMAVSRCENCGYPVWLRKLASGGYFIGGVSTTCSHCGEPT